MYWILLDSTIVYHVFAFPLDSGAVAITAAASVAAFANQLKWRKICSVRWIFFYQHGFLFFIDVVLLFFVLYIYITLCADSIDVM